MTSLADAPTTARDLSTQFDLARLVAPLDVTTFLHDYWERKPLYVRRDDPGYYADLLTLDDVDRMLFLAGVHLDGIRVVVEGKETPVSQLSSHGKLGLTNSLEALYDRYRGGSTIALNSLSDRVESLHRAAQTLGAEINARIQMNVYLTPGGNAQGFNPHYDTHDVFIAQVYGTKRWRLYDSPYALPLRETRYNKSESGPGDPAQEIVMGTGDLLYLPRGTVHAATSNDTASAHITVGVHPVLWSSVIAEAVQRLFTEDARFRGSLPVGFANDPQALPGVEETFRELAELIVRQLNPAELAVQSARQAVSISTPALRHHLTDLEQVSAVDATTRVYRRPDIRWSLTVDEQATELNFHNKSVRLPTFVAEEVRYVAESNGSGFTGETIPGDLDEPGRVLLVQTLLREGFLTLS